ncbi:MAG: thiamine phosphate synthase [Gammaproteobacteria bacterium]|nr:thiamine phosphate synthase [Gammaproteobacteria bacterium]
MKSLSGLYAITDAELIAQARFAETVEQALQGGAHLIQYRDKTRDHGKRLQQAQAVKQLCQRYQALCIINDDLELALAIQADGLHIGRDDGALPEIRQRLGEDKIIGVSCYNDLTLAETAAQQGADYIAFGSFFPSPTKPEAQAASLELLTLARNTIQRPICAIGGITRDNAGPLLAAGADMLAVISDVFGQDDVVSASRAFQTLFETHHR